MAHIARDTKRAKRNPIAFAKAFFKSLEDKNRIDNHQAEIVKLVYENLCGPTLVSVKKECASLKKRNERQKAEDLFRDYLYELFWLIELMERNKIHTFEYIDPHFSKGDRTTTKEGGRRVYIHGPSKDGSKWHIEFVGANGGSLSPKQVEYVSGNELAPIEKYLNQDHTFMRAISECMSENDVLNMVYASVEIRNCPEFKEMVRGNWDVPLLLSNFVCEKFLLLKDFKQPSPEITAKKFFQMLVSLYVGQKAKIITDRYKLRGLSNGTEVTIGVVNNKLSKTHVSVVAGDRINSIKLTVWAEEVLPNQIPDNFLTDLTARLRRQ